jgi:hypothetical protein
VPVLWHGRSVASANHRMHAEKPVPLSHTKMFSHEIEEIQTNPAFRRYVTNCTLKVPHV